MNKIKKALLLAASFVMATGLFAGCFVPIVPPTYSSSESSVESSTESSVESSVESSTESSVESSVESSTESSVEAQKYNFTVVTDKWALDGATTTEVEAGATLVFPADPTAEGKTFAGWVDIEGNAVAEGATMPEEDFAIFASWTVNAYTLTIKEEGKEDVTLKFGVEAVPETETEPEIIDVNSLDFVLSMLYADTDDAAYKFEKPEAWTLADTEITAYTVAKYSFTVITDRWAMDGTTTTRVAAGDTLTLPADPEVEGKTFTGWIDLEGNAVAEGATMPEEDFAIFATFTVDVYTLTIKEEGKEDVTLKFAVEAIYAEDPADAVIGIDALDYELSVLYAGNDEVLYKFEKPKAWELKDTTITAYTVTAYTLTIVTGNPRLDPNASVSMKVAGGDMVELPADPEVAGKTFTGWEDIDGNPITQDFAMPEAHVAIYATFSINVYTLTIKEEGKEDVTLKFAVEAIYAEDPADAVIGIDALDYELSMLYVGDDDVAYKFEKPEAWTLEDTEITAYTVAKYSFTVVTDRWAMDGATTTRLEAGATLVFPADPTAEGKTFAGWVDLEGNAVAEGTTMPEEDFAVYASWTVNAYTLTVNRLDDTVDTYKFGVEAVPAEDPADEIIDINSLEWVIGFDNSTPTNACYEIVYSGIPEGGITLADTTISEVEQLKENAHQNFSYTDNGNGTHAKACADCGARLKNSEVCEIAWLEEITENGTKVKGCAQCGHAEMEVDVINDTVYELNPANEEYFSIENLIDEKFAYLNWINLYWGDVRLFDFYEEDMGMDPFAMESSVFGDAEGAQTLKMGIEADDGEMYYVDVIVNIVR